MPFWKRRHNEYEDAYESDSEESAEEENEDVAYDSNGLSPDDALYEEAYSDAYDGSGGEVYCESCGDLIVWYDRRDVYMCRKCGREYSREEFFNYAGIDVPGEKCYDCDNLYPGCTWCPNDYDV